MTPEDFMSRKERQQLMKTCKEHYELDLIKGRQTWPIRYMLIDLALYSGLRESEMAALKVGDLVFNESDPFIIVRHGKGNKKRTVYIDQKLAKHLKEFINYHRSFSSFPSHFQDIPNPVTTICKDNALRQYG